MIGNPVRPVCIGNVNLDHDQLWRVAKREQLHMFVHIVARSSGDR
jgi:hypothetical protein